SPSCATSCGASRWPPARRIALSSWPRQSCNPISTGASGRNRFFSWMADNERAARRQVCEGRSPMDLASLEYRLTPEERHEFEETGLLRVEDALSAEQVATLTAATDRIYESHRQAGAERRTALFYPNFIPEDNAFCDLVDYGRVLPKVWALLG